MNGTLIAVAGVFFVLGFAAHIAWDYVADLLAAATGYAGGLFWDLCAVVGIIALIVAGVLGWQHYH